jgi:hypothetical protein
MGDVQAEKIKEYEGYLKQANNWIRESGQYSEMPLGMRKIIVRGIIEYEDKVRGMKNEFL